MSKFIKIAVLPLAFVYGLSVVCDIFFKISLTPQKINSQKVNPKVLEYGLIFKGYDPFVAEVGRRMYENGDFEVDKNGMFA